MKKTLLIFDMDGTLIDSSVVISNAINHVRKKLSLPPLKKEDILSVVNDMHIHSPRYFYDADDFTQDHIVWFQEYYTAYHDKDVALYEGIVSLLESVQKKYTLTLATNAYRQSTLQLLAHVGIEGFFEMVVCADDVKESKPSGEMIEKILSAHDCHPSKALMIGDSLKDKEAASRAGVETILVDWGFSDLDGACEKVDELGKLLGV
jgi:phosphoglycolate phosphatase